MITDITAIKVDILDIKSKLESFISKDVANDQSPPNVVPKNPDPPAATCEPKETVTLNAEIHIDVDPDHDHDITVASIEEDVDILEEIHPKPVPTNQSN